MIKKLVIYGIIGVVGWNAIKNTRFASHVRTEIAAMRKAVDENTSPEKDLARIKADIKLLDLDIQKQIRPLANENVRVRELKEQVTDLRAKQSQSEKALHARAAAIKSATEEVTFGDSTVPIGTAKAQLEDGVKRYTASQKSLESLELTLATRERIRDTMEKQIDAMKVQRDELGAAVNALEAEIKLLQLQQMESKYQTDGTRMARVKEDIRDLKTKVAVHREELKLLPAAFDAPATTTATSKSVDDIMAPLSAPAKGSKAAAMPPASD